MADGVMRMLLEMDNYEAVYVTKNNSTFLKCFFFTSSTLGIALTASALLVLILTAVLFKEWREKYKNRLLIQFMFARFLYALRRYVSNRLYFPDKATFVRIESLTMIYTELALVFWMYVFSKLMYDCFVKVFKTSNSNLCTVSLRTWLLPGLITLIFHLSLCFKSDINYEHILLCLFFIKWPVIFANGILLILTLKSILRLNMSNTENNARIIIVINILIVSFCIQQVMVDVYRMIFKSDSKTEYVIVVLNILSMYHCALSILFWVFGNSKTRELWKFSKLNVNY